MNSLNSARQKIFLVAGAGKRAALERILPGNSLPAARVVVAECHIDQAAMPGGDKQFQQSDPAVLDS